jgi:hypothetical protein
MATFVLEVYRPGLTRRASQAIVRTVVRAIAPGSPVRFLGSSLAPADEICYVQLESPERAAVDDLAARLGFSDARVAEVINLE